MSEELSKFVENYKKSGNTVMKDVYEYYGITEEEYVISVSGIGNTNNLRKFGIEL